MLATRLSREETSGIAGTIPHRNVRQVEAKGILQKDLIE